MKISFTVTSKWKQIILFMGIAAITQAQTIVQTFSFTGGMQTFTVPSCVSNITIVAHGAKGGSNLNNVSGGLGGSATGVLPVSSGNVLYVMVGGSNGYNGGGLPVSSGCSLALGGSGGGGSDVRLNTNNLASRVIVAGGGGGAGGERISGCGRGTGGGGGGGYYGGGGGAGWGSSPLPQGGTQLAGGAGGVSSSAPYNGQAGSLAQGGNGGGETTSSQLGNNTAAVGGVGGGLTGGAGACTLNWTGQSGAGGSSYVLSTLTNTSTTSGDWSGNGVVTFSYNYNGAGVNVASTSNSICAGQTVTFTASNVLSYTWTPGGSNATTYTAAPSALSTYTVQGTNNLGCISTSVITVTVDPGLPTLTVANTASSTGGICPTNTVALTASGATTYSWTNSVTNGVPFAPTNSTTYVVTGANACGTSTAATSISVHPLPTVNAVASQASLCSGSPALLSGVGNAVSYSVVNIGIPHGINFYPIATAQYTVVGFSAQGCSNTAVTTITVVTTPMNPPIPSPQLICIGSSATITTSGATNYTWTTPSGPVSGSFIVVSPTVTSNYTITKSNSNCVNTQTVDIFVNQLPSIFAIVSPTIVCASHTAALQAAGAQTYTWTAPSYSAIGSSPVVSPSVSTMYTVTASDGTCVNTGTVFLATNPNPTINIVPTSSVICQGDNVSLTASGAIGYSWTTVGIVSNTNNPTITETPTSSTLYQVTGINNFNCTSTSQQVVVVQATPTLVINTNKPLVCSGAASNLTVNAVQGVQCTYIWSPNAGSATSSVVTVNPLSTTFYTAIGTAANGCTATVNYPVSVFLPTFAVNNPTSSCLGGTINLIASGANSYTWNGTAPFAQISVSPPTATVYVCAATSNSTGVNCVSTQTVQVSIYNNPTITAVPSRTQICRGEETEITADGAVSYAWNTGQTGSVVPVNPIANTVYTVVGTDINGCVGTTTVLVKTSVCYGITKNSENIKFKLYPNPSRGILYIESSSNLELEILNELGQVLQVFKFSDGKSQIDLSTYPKGIYFIKDLQQPSAAYYKVLVDR